MFCVMVKSFKIIVWLKIIVSIICSWWEWLLVIIVILFYCFLFIILYFGIFFIEDYKVIFMLNECI